MNTRRTSQRSAFTLVEILLVVAILALLIALAFPALNSLRNNANRTASLSNLRQIALALRQFAMDADGYLPPQVDLSSGLDWSGQLVVAGLLDPGSLAAPGDRRPRRDLSPPAAIGALFRRSYAINDAKYTYLGNGYQSPWPKSIGTPGAKLINVPMNIILAGENFGGGEGSGAFVGVAESEGLGGLAADLYPDGGACYVRADASAFFAKPTAPMELEHFRADTDYGGDLDDPWKWKQ